MQCSGFPGCCRPSWVLLVLVVQVESPAHSCSCFQKTQPSEVSSRPWCLHLIRLKWLSLLHCDPRKGPWAGRCKVAACQACGTLALWPLVPQTPGMLPAAVTSFPSCTHSTGKALRWAWQLRASSHRLLPEGLRFPDGCSRASRFLRGVFFFFS